MKPWILFNNPSRYDLCAFLLSGKKTLQYKVRPNESSVKDGDRGVLRIGGSLPGVYALANIVSSPQWTDDYADKFNIDPGLPRPAWRVYINITINLVGMPLTLDMLSHHGIVHPLLEKAPRDDSRASSAPLHPEALYDAIMQLATSMIPQAEQNIWDSLPMFEKARRARIAPIAPLPVTVRDLEEELFGELMCRRLYFGPAWLDCIKMYCGRARYVSLSPAEKQEAVTRVRRRLNSRS